MGYEKKSDMLVFLSKNLCRRATWFTFLTITALPFSMALVFQYYLELPPCVLCIYQRIALLGIGVSAMLSMLAPACYFLRKVSTVLWIYSAWKGLAAAWEETQRYLYPERFTACAFQVNFPKWLPLDQWAPSIFKAYAACEPLEWFFLGLKLPQWLVVLFSIYLVLGICLLFVIISDLRECGV